MKELVVELGIPRNHLVPKSDSVLHILLQLGGQVGSLRCIFPEGVVGQLAVIDFRYHIFLPLKEYNRQHQQEEKENNPYNL